MTEPRIVSSAPAAGRAIALTFDDGPSGSTLELLDILDTFEARATFFVVGAWVERRREVVGAVATRDHELGNHTWSHFDGRTLLEQNVWRDEIERTTVAIAEAAHRPPRLFRPPFGAVPDQFAAVAALCGLEATVMWSVQSSDYEGAEDDARIEAEVLAGVQPGAIVLHHDGDWRDDLNSGSPQAGTVRALPRILERLANDGYRFVTVSELLAA